MFIKSPFLKSFCAAIFTSTLSFMAHATEQLTTFTLAGWSKPISEITQVLAEPDLQFFKKEGLNLTYLPGAGGGDAIRNVLSGQADIAFTDPGSFFSALSQGAPLRAVYDIYPKNVFNVVSLTDSGITRAADLKGKKIGVYSLSSGTKQNLQILLHQAGIKEDEVEIIVTGLLNFSPLMRGQVDATAATDTGLLVAKYRGLKNPTVIEVADYLDYSSDLFVVREADYQHHPERIAQFLQAYKNATQWMIENPDEAAQLAQRYAIDGQDIALNEQIIKARNAASEPTLTQKKSLGAINADSLQKAANVYFELGLIKNKLNISNHIATDLLTK